MNKRLFTAVLLFITVFSAFCSTEKPEINKFDALVVRPYNSTLSKASMATAVATAITPAFLYNQDKNQYPLIGTMYAETMGISWLTKSLLKKVVNRERPYMYFEGAPQKDIDNGNYMDSFPSGHTMLAFAAAAFTSYTYCKYNPESQYKTPVVATSFGLATATATLRVMSGNHYLTDVLTSAIIGSAIGVAVPLIHSLFAKQNGTQTQKTPFSFAFGFSL